jgi:hypothetical protein
MDGARMRLLHRRRQQASVHNKKKGNKESASLRLRSSPGKINIVRRISQDAKPERMGHTLMYYGNKKRFYKHRPKTTHWLWEELQRRKLAFIVRRSCTQTRTAARILRARARIMNLLIFILLDYRRLPGWHLIVYNIKAKQSE